MAKLSLTKSGLQKQREELKLHRRLLPSLDLKRMLSGVQLPALPQSAIRLLELSQDPDNGPAEFAIPIEADPGLTGQVLRLGLELLGIETIEQM